MLTLYHGRFAPLTDDFLGPRPAKALHGISDTVGSSIWRQRANAGKRDR
jgi:hypothetical protein